MLKGIPPIISPELMKAMMEMGHGDEIVLADANFPAVSVGARVIRSDGHGLPELLEAMLAFLPLDRSVDRPAVLMEPLPDGTRPAIWENFRAIIARHEPQFAEFEHLERFAYYERARSAFAVVITGERAPRANLILAKGVVRD